MRATANEPRASVRSGMRVEDFPYFTSIDDEFFGMCDGTALAQVNDDRSHTCRVWLADTGGQRGLYLFVPAAAFDEIPILVANASFLMREPFQVCTDQRHP
jgi:hypothetical protein